MHSRCGLSVLYVLALVLPSLADEAESPQVSLGITVQSKDLADARLMSQGAPSLKSRSCVVVSKVDPSGPSAGKLSEDNAIISIDGVPTADVEAYEKAVKGLKPDNEIVIKGLYLAPAPLGEKKWVPGSVTVKTSVSRPVQNAAAQPAGNNAEDLGKDSKDAAELRKKSRPTWPDCEDLDALLASFPKGRMSAMEQFIRYGTPDKAQKAIRGDRFDREEAEAAADGHRDTLPKRSFFIQRRYKWLDKRVSDIDPDAVCLQISLLFRCLMSPDDPSVQVSACNERDLWFLTKDGDLKRCPNRAVAHDIERNNGVLYVPELLDRCNLQIWFDGDREMAKRIAREPANFVVNIRLSGLELERPQTRGFFHLKTLREALFDTTSLLRGFEHGLLRGPDDEPNYFVVESLKGIDQESIPEVASAVLKELEIVEVVPEGRKLVFEWSD